MNRNKIISFYENFKNSPKKLKIVCDWDEVIQPCEPWASYLAKKHIFPNDDKGFEDSYRDFWCLYDEEYIKILKEQDDCDNELEYSPYDSKIKDGAFVLDENMKLLYEKNKLSPNLYQEAPFLTTAEDLLKLIREDKVDKLIFLSAHDKRKFPNGDKRKKEIFLNIFYKFAVWENFGKLIEGDWISLPFDSEILERAEFHQTLDNKTKGQWIRENFPDCDIVIDDNPKILKEILDTARVCKECYGIMTRSNAPLGLPKCKAGKCIKTKAALIAPYYPATENQHDERVLLVKNEVLGERIFTKRKTS